MRKSLFYLVLFLVGCGGSGGEEFFVSDLGQPATPPVLKHFPEIIDLAMSPDTVTFMEGDGNVVATAEITFRDTGQDLKTLWIRRPDGTTIEFEESFDTETGTIVEDFDISTERIGALTIEFWLVDKAGDSSIHHYAEFSVAGNAQSSNWTSRLSGLPYALNDVIWDGTVFVAVGDGGTILTSADGIDWVARDSTTEASLHAIGAYGQDIFAVGDAIVLLSTDHGESWVAKAGPDYAALSAVSVNSSHVVVAGNGPGLFGSFISISEDRGDTWQYTDINCGTVCYYITDLDYRDGLFIAASRGLFSGGKAILSLDGAIWTEVFHAVGAGLLAIVHDGSRYVISGGNGTVFTSYDGFNWTTMLTPVVDADYLSAAWNGSKLVLAGGYSGGVVPSFEVPIGISSTDGGVSWEVFNIDGNYQSLGMAFGNGLFVSVGQSTPHSVDGAIYTAD